MDNKQQLEVDKQIIIDFGGPAKLAEELGYDKKKGGVQRVANWLTRGIPPKVKLDRPDIFLRRIGDGSPQKDSGAEHAAAA